MIAVCVDNNFGFKDRLTIGKHYIIEFIDTRIYPGCAPGLDGIVIDDNGEAITFARPLYYGRFIPIEIYREEQLNKLGI